MTIEEAREIVKDNSHKCRHDNEILTRKDYYTSSDPILWVCPKCGWHWQEYLIH